MNNINSNQNNDDIYKDWGFPSDSNNSTNNNLNVSNNNDDLTDVNTKTHICGVKHRAHFCFCRNIGQTGKRQPRLSDLCTDSKKG